jgi:hypothetical protein
MKKFLTLGVLFAALAATVGCDDKKTTAGPVKPATSGSSTATGSGPASTGSH